VNLQAITAGAVGAINPPLFCTLRVSTGYTIAADASQVPTYAVVTGVSCQIQALTYTDLMKLGSLNLEGIRRKIYLGGDIEGVDRAAIKGGDVFTFPNGDVWLVAQVLEHWGGRDGWTSVAVTRQNNA
jgi:hypothetical protein